jgi:catechol 2,3-dioxygenase-like lactoylglutathione lyase family enzyme
MGSRRRQYTKYKSIMAISSNTATSRPPVALHVKGLHHIKLASSNVLATQKFYTSILSFTPLPQFNHYTPDHKLFAVMFAHQATNTIIEARYSPSRAALEKGWDPITWAVSKRADLDEWAKWLDQGGIRHSKVIKAIKSWVMCAEDPDGRIVRLYVVDEEHEWTDHPDVDKEWIENIEADPNAETGK